MDNSHTWTKLIVDISEDFYEDDMYMSFPSAQGIIIVAFYIPNYVEDVTIEIYGTGSDCSYLEISDEDNISLESLLLAARTLPDINNDIQIDEDNSLSFYI